MDKLRTTIILSLIIVILATTVIVAYSQPIDEELPEPIQAQEEATYKVVPLITIHEGKDTPETESATEATTEPSETIAETESSTTSYYNVNLSEYVQDVIFAECEKYGIPPSIVIAMIERESQFQVYAMGDDGRSFGLMQIQPKWHLQRMIDMGCTDLFDPIQNVKVGIAILGDLKNQHNDIGWALTAYNSGSGGLNAYAMAVIERANEL